MEKIEVEIMKDLSEAIPYDTKGIPLYIRTRNLSDYVNMRSFPHWHDEIELMYIVDGRMNYNVNGNTMLLDTNDCVIVNCRQMHYSRSFEHQECTFFVLIFHPQLFTGHSFVYNKYVLPVINNHDFKYRYFNSQHPFHRRISRLIKDVNKYKDDSSYGYEMKIIGSMHLFWSDFIHCNRLVTENLPDADNSDLKTQQDMLLFIHQNYMNKITLDDIAVSGNVCRSKCCTIFRHYLNTSPIDFLNQYRLETSCKLLCNSKLNITDIAINCGFVHNSYYSQMFRKFYKCSPREYRENYIQNKTSPPIHPEQIQNKLQWK